MYRIFGLLLTLAAAACVMQPGPPTKFELFFIPYSAKLDGAATETVANAASVAKTHPTWPVNVVGYADPIGNIALSREISLNRAQAVEDQLVADGVDRSRIIRVAMGATPYTESSQESRRVEITFGGP